jgi:hypothetical protein
MVSTAVGTVDGTPWPRLRLRPRGFDADQFRARGTRRKCERHSGNKPAAAHRDQHEVGHKLVGYLQTDCALAGDHERIVVGVNEQRAGARADFLGGAMGLEVVGARELDRLAVAARRVDLGDGGRGRHHDRRAHARARGRPGQRLPMIARRRGDSAARRLGRRQRRDSVVGPANLERAGLLQILGLEVDLRA